MDELAQAFEADRARLRGVAVRMLGSPAEADDAVQEAWLRLHRHGAEDVANLHGWLTTVVARVCLDMLRSRRTRREAPFLDVPEPVVDGPENDAVLADSVGLALTVVLDTLAPAERVAFVLHDLFGVPFEEVAPVVGRTPAAARQLASRARRRVQGGAVDPDPSVGRRAVVEAFLAASRGGDMAALLALLDPDAVLRADPAAVAYGAAPEVHGAAAVAETFAGRAQAARLAVVDGAPGAVWSVGGVPRVVFAFTVSGDRVSAIDLLADAVRLAALDIVHA
jgi:RNA polymerase sigma factor (sigma-70 family)